MPEPERFPPVAPVKPADPPLRAEAGAGVPTVAERERELMRRARPRAVKLRFAALLLLLALVAAAVKWTPLGTLLTGDGIMAIREALRSVPGITVLFVLVYAAGAAVALPGSILTMAGGALFGLWPGVALNLLGSTVGATLAYLVARGLGRAFVVQRLGRRAMVVDRSAAGNGFRVILLLRLFPLIPFNALNYGCGLSGVKLRHYIPATFLGTIPAIFVYTYFADALLVGSVEARREAYAHLVLAVGLLILFTLLPVLWRKWQKRRAARGGPVPPGPAAPGAI